MKVPEEERMMKVQMLLGLAFLLVFSMCAGACEGKPSHEPGETMVWEKDGAVMVYIPEGKFLMGSSEDDTLARADEKPQREVLLDAFWIDQTEVTNQQYQQCVDAGECTLPGRLSSNTRKDYFGNPDYDQYPAMHITWFQAEAYCHWAGRRLPTEAEWEKAARGTDGRIWPWGNEQPNETLTNFMAIVRDTTKVGSYPQGASPYGVFDMAGNVFEWVSDWWAWDTYRKGPDENPQGPETGKDKVLRGGSWVSDADAVRSAYRHAYSPDQYPFPHGDHSGIRCAISAAEAGK
jgi:formylglycine-generating enzyme required for sulfatase activity